MSIRTVFILVALASLALGVGRHYVPTNSEAAAQGSAAAAPGKKSATAEAANWPLYRGNSLATGVAKSSLADEPELLWKFPVKEGAFEATAVIHDGLVFVGDLDGVFYALDLKDGTEKWRFKGETGFNAAAAVRRATKETGALVYVGDMHGVFYCLDAASGQKKWDFPTQAEINSSPNFYNDRVLVGSQDATLYCLNAETGEEVWKHEIEDQIRCMPTVVENRAFLAGCDGRLHIIDLDKGESVGEVQIDAPTGSTPAVSGSMVYFGTEGGTFFGIDWKKAEVVWKFRDKKRNQPFRSSAAVTEKAVFVGGRDKVMRALEPESGDELWAFPTRGRVDSSAVIVGQRAFFGSADGRIYAVTADTGKEVWQYEAGGSFTASPAVADGRLVIASDDGIVYCFGTK